MCRRHNRHTSISSTVRSMHYVQLFVLLLVKPTRMLIFYGMQAMFTKDGIACTTSHISFVALFTDCRWLLIFTEWRTQP